VNKVSKLEGASAAKLATRLRPLSFLMFNVNSKLDFGLPRSDGSFEVTLSLAGNSLASTTFIANAASLRWPSA
jgi:hypothetical protein